MTGIEPTQSELLVRRVSNGWIVFRRSTVMHESEAGFVARTPKELADLIADWATKQQDQPVVKP